MKIKAILIWSIMCFMLSGCGNAVSTDNNDEKIKVLCESFSEYDWTRNIVGDSENVDVDILIKNGVDIHSYQPSADDAAKIYQSSLFIYNGGNSDMWVQDIIKNEAVESINIMESIGEYVLEEELAEGMQAEEDEEEKNGQELDEHLWLSVKNAVKVCDIITEKLNEIDPDGNYEANNEEYKNKLYELDNEYESLDFKKPVVFADRFPFLYTVRDYNIDYYAAFPGCSAETQASFETVIFLADKIDENGINAVGVTESSDKSIADAVISNTSSKNQEIVVFNSMQSISIKDIESGMDYISVMRENLEAFKKLL